MSAGNVYRQFQPRDSEYLRVSLKELVEISSNEAYYHLDPDSTPKLERINAATDPALRLQWAASNSDAVEFSLALPEDFDDTKDVEVKIRAAMAGSTDEPTFTVSTFPDEGGTEISDSTGAVSGTDYGWVTATVSNADLSSPNVLNITLTPDAHTTDALYVTAIRVKVWRDRR